MKISISTSIYFAFWLVLVLVIQASRLANGSELVTKTISSRHYHSRSAFLEFVEKKCYEFTDPRLAYAVIVRTLEGHQFFVRDLNLLPNGLLASGAYDHDIRLWNITTGKCIDKFYMKGAEVFNVGHLKNGSLVSSHSDSTVKILDPADRAIKLLRGHAGRVFTVVALDDNRVASGAEDKKVIVWNLERSDKEFELLGHTDMVLKVAVLPNGDLVSASWDKSVKIWNLANQTLRYDLLDHSEPLYTVATLPNGDVASGGQDRKINIWNARRGTLRKSLVNVHDEYIMSLFVMPNGVLASTSEGGEVKFWDTKTWTLKGKFRAHDAGVTSLVALPDGQFATSSLDQTVRIWRFNDEFQL